MPILAVFCSESLFLWEWEQGYSPLSLLLGSIYVKTLALFGVEVWAHNKYGTLWFCSYPVQPEPFIWSYCLFFSVCISVFYIKQIGCS